MNIAEYRNRIRQDILDIDPDTTGIFTEESIDRAILSACEDLSRWFPNEGIYELIPSNRITTATVATVVNLVPDITIDFPAKGIRFGSVVIKDNLLNTLTENTDYIMDYYNGLITFPTGSIIFSNGAASVNATWENSLSVFDLTTIKQLRSINGIRVVTGTRDVDGFGEFNLLGNLLVNSRDIPENYRLIIEYSSRHTPPDDNNDGTIPEYLSEVVIKGAVAHLLFAKAISLELEQSSNYNTLPDIAGYITTILGDLTSARGQLTTAITRAGSVASAIDGVVTRVYADIDLGVAELADVETALAAVGTALTTGLLFIDTEVASLIASASAESAAGVTVLGDAATAITTGQGLLDDYTGRIAAAVQYLTDGDAFFNQVNIGDSVPAEYAAYSKAMNELMQTDILGGKEYVATAAQRLGISEIRVRNATNYLEAAKAQIGISSAYNNAAETYIKQAATKLNQAGFYLEAAKDRIAILQSYLDAVKSYMDVVGGYQKSAEIVGTVIQATIAAATEVRAQGTFIMEVAERIRQEAIRRYSDFKETISDRTQMRKVGATVSRNQLR